MALLARIFVLWAGSTWRPDHEEEVVRPERLAADLSALTGVGQAQATKAIATLEAMGKKLAEDRVRDLVGTYLEMLSILGLPGDGLERHRQEQGLGRFSELLADFEHAQRRAAPVEWLRATEPSHLEEATEDAVIHEAVISGEPEPQAPAAKPGATPGGIFLARLRVFLEEFASAAAEEAPDSPAPDKDAVNIMTVHQAKGLEFPIVFLPALVDKRFPSVRLGTRQDWYLPESLFCRGRYEGREDDERRLFYVAMTRARDLLVLSRFSQYASTAAEPSRFLRDLARCPHKTCIVKPPECRPAPCPPRNGHEAVLETDFGQLLTFSECPRKYYLRHVCGFRPPIAPELGFGKALHHVLAELARHAQGGRPPTGTDVDAVLASSFYLPFASPAKREHLFQAARRRLQAYASRYGRELLRTVEPEHPFEVPMESARLSGRIDLLLRAEGGGPQDVELIDFKTAANRPPSEHHKNQLRVYAEAARTLGLNPVRLVIHDLEADHGGPIEVRDDERARQAFKGQLHGWIERIRGADFSPPRQVDCRPCDFHRICHQGVRRPV